MKKDKSEYPFLGIALGGGGVRGAAHVGVLQVLDKEKIKIGSISGVSAGAIIAAMYAYSLDAIWIEKRFRNILSSSLFNKVLQKSDIINKPSNSMFTDIKNSFYKHVIALTNLHKLSIIDNSLLQEILSLLIPINTFEELRIPLKIISTDLKSGNDIINDRGDLITALIQSCAIPGIFKPISQGSNLIVDGGISNPIPIMPIKNECHFNLVVDIGMYQFQELDDWNVLSIKQRSSIITSNALKRQLASLADFVITPDTAGVKWSNFDDGEMLLNNGKLAGEQNISSLKNMITKKKNILSAGISS